MNKRYGIQRQCYVRSSAIGSTVNLLSFIFGRIYFPAYSNGLEGIASLIGAKWQARSLPARQVSRGGLLGDAPHQ